MKLLLGDSTYISQGEGQGGEGGQGTCPQPCGEARRIREEETGARDEVPAGHQQEAGQQGGRREEVLRREQERLEQLERREQRQYIDNVLDEVADLVEVEEEAEGSKQVLDVEHKRVLDDAKSTRRRTAWRQTGTRRKTTMGVTLLTTASRGRGLRTAGPGWLCVSGPGQGTMKEEERKENVKKRKKIGQKCLKTVNILKFCPVVLSCLVL